MLWSIYQQVELLQVQYTSSLLLKPYVPRYKYFVIVDLHFAIYFFLTIIRLSGAVYFTMYQVFMSGLIQMDTVPVHADMNLLPWTYRIMMMMMMMNCQRKNLSHQDQRLTSSYAAFCLILIFFARSICI